MYINRMFEAFLEEKRTLSKDRVHLDVFCIVDCPSVLFCSPESHYSASKSTPFQDSKVVKTGIGFLTPIN